MNNGASSGGAGGGASIINNGGAGTGTTSNPGGVAANTFSSAKFMLEKQYRVDCGSAGGAGRSNGALFAGANGGGVLIIEVGGNLTGGSATINVNGAVGANSSGIGSNDGGAGGGGGGAAIVLYRKALTGSITINSNGGLGGNQ